MELQPLENPSGFGGRKGFVQGRRPRSRGARSPPMIGTTLQNRYRIDSELGRGGMAAARTQLGEAAFASAWAEGWARTMEQANEFYWPY